MVNIVSRGVLVVPPTFALPWDDAISGPIMRTYYLAMRTTVMKAIRSTGRFNGGNPRLITFTENAKGASIHFGPYVGLREPNILVRLSPGYSEETVSGFKVWRHHSLVIREGLLAMLKDHPDTGIFFADGVWVGNR